MASRVKKTRTGSTNTEGYAARSGSTQTVIREPDKTTQGAASDLKITKIDRGFVITFRIPVTDICLD